MIKYGRWKVEFTCVDCDSRLEEYDRMYSNGVCPHCGWQAMVGTICASNRKVVRNVYTYTPKWLGLFKDFVITKEYKDGDGQRN